MGTPVAPPKPPDPFVPAAPSAASALEPDPAARASSIVVKIGLLDVPALVDSGASHTLISRALTAQLALPTTADWPFELATASGAPLGVTSSAVVDLKVGNRSVRWRCGVAPNLPLPIVLGADILHAIGASVDLGALLLRLPRSVPVKLALSARLPDGSVASAQPSPATLLVLARETTLPARAEVVVPASLPLTSVSLPPGSFLAAPLDLNSGPGGVYCSSGAVSASCFAASRCLPYVVLNSGKVPVTLPAGYILAALLPIAAPDAPKFAGAAAVSPEDAFPDSFPDLAPWTDESWVDALERVIPSDLPAAESARLRDFLTRNRDVFSSDPSKVRPANVPAHTIPTALGQPPLRQPPRRVHPALQEVHAAEVDKMLAAGVIKPSSSPWASASVLVRKKDGSFRFCVDYRRLNNVTIGDAYPLPRIDEILDQFAGKSLFAQLDCQQGYWQVRLDPADAGKSAFHTPRGLMEFTVMPFGLANAPATFQRTMDVVLSGLIGLACWVYLDDIIVASTTFDEHLKQLQLVFDRLRAAGLSLKLPKCNFAKPSLLFLGHIVSGQGVAPDPVKVQAVADMPRPLNKSMIQEFIGGASYFRRFIANFSSTAKPLTDLTGNVPFDWTPACEEAFTTIKQRLVSAPILACPVWSQPFQLHTDASRLGLGAMLTQVIDGHERVILYASRKLNNQERNYGISELECTAVVWACDHLRPYLLGAHFDLFTDHEALLALRSAKDLRGRLLRYALLLQEFDFTTHYRPGRLHSGADVLSRFPVGPAPPDVAFVPSVSAAPVVPAPLAPVPTPPPAAVQPLTPPPSPLPPVSPPSSSGPAGPPLEPALPNLPADPLLSWSRDRWLAAQHSDPWCLHLLEYITDGWLPANKTDAAALRSSAADFRVDDGLLVHSASAPPRLAVPLGLRRPILAALHDAAGHLGFARTVSLVEQRFLWPDLKSDVREYVRSCTACQARYSPHTQPAGLLEPIRVAGPWELVGIDLLTPLPVTASDNKHALICIDYLTKFVVAFALQRIDSISVAKCLRSFILRLRGPPRAFISDRGTQFMGAPVQELLASFGIEHKPTTAYHQQANGLVERMMATFSDMLAKVVSRDQSDWDDHLEALAFAYNGTPHSSSGFSPHYLLFGCEALFPLDHTIPVRPQSSTTAVEFRTRTEALLSAAREAALANLDKAHDKQKANYDASRREVSFKVGDQVAIKMPPTGVPPKFASPWRLAYTVVERQGELNYKIVRDGKSQVVHVDRLKPYYTRGPDQLQVPAPQTPADPSPQVPPSESTPPVPTPAATLDREALPDGVYIVRAIVDRRSVYKDSRRSFEYLCTWEGYPDDHRTWQSEPSLKGCQGLINAYDEHHPRPRRRRKR